MCVDIYICVSVCTSEQMDGCRGACTNREHQPQSRPACCWYSDEYWQYVRQQSPLPGRLGSDSQQSCQFRVIICACVPQCVLAFLPVRASNAVRVLGGAGDPGLGRARSVSAPSLVTRRSMV